MSPFSLDDGSTSTIRIQIGQQTHESDGKEISAPCLPLPLAVVEAAKFCCAAVDVPATAGDPDPMRSSTLFWRRFEQGAQAQV